MEISVFCYFFCRFYALKVGGINQLAMLKLLYYYHSKVALHYSKVALHYDKSCTFEIKNTLFLQKVCFLFGQSKKKYYLCIVKT